MFEPFAADPPAPDTDDPVALMAQRPATEAGRELYALRKHMIEPVFGIIKQVMGLRQLSMRGLDHAVGEGRLVTMAWNIKRLYRLMAAYRDCRPQSGATELHGSRHSRAKAGTIRPEDHPPQAPRTTLRRSSEFESERLLGHFTGSHPRSGARSDMSWT